MKKLISVLFAALLVFSVFSPSTEAAKSQTAVVSAKVANVRAGAGTDYKIVGTLKKGTKVTVSSIKNKKWATIRYNKKTAYVSKSLLTFKTTSTSPNFKKYNGDWFTSTKNQPGVGVNLKFMSETKAKIDLYGIWWSMPDGSNARESDAYGYNITFDKNGVGKVTFTESRAGNKGIATVKLSGNKLILTVKYPSSYKENELFDSYIYKGTHKLVPKKF